MSEGGGLALGGAPNGICDPWARWFGACLAPTGSFPFPFPLFPFPLPSGWVAAARRDPAATHPTATHPRPTQGGGGVKREERARNERATSGKLKNLGKYSKNLPKM